MVALLNLITRRFEYLSLSAIAVGVGDGEYRVPQYGTQEVRPHSRAFAEERNEIQQTNRALVESERLATIGRMASSISYDLRHYLAAIYANSEFLVSHQLTEKERAEIFADVRAAVHGTTDMIESLLIFSRTGVSRKKASGIDGDAARRTGLRRRTGNDFCPTYGLRARRAENARGRELDAWFSSTPFPTGGSFDRRREFGAKSILARRVAVERRLLLAGSGIAASE